MEYITDKGIILMVLLSDFLIIIGVSIVFLVAQIFAKKQPSQSQQILKIVTIINPIIVIVFGIFAETVIILKILWSMGYI